MILTSFISAVVKFSHIPMFNVQISQPSKVTVELTCVDCTLSSKLHSKTRK
jgi:hypothetical protein